MPINPHNPFEGRQYPGEVIVLCVRWYLLNKRCRPHLKPTNKSYRIDETYINVKGQDKYLYRALDSTGQAIDFLLTAKRDTAAAKRFLRRAIDASGNPMPRVMNVDKNPAYPAAVEALKADGGVAIAFFIPMVLTLTESIAMQTVTISLQSHHVERPGALCGRCCPECSSG
jgi:transposase-like protein